MCFGIGKWGCAWIVSAWNLYIIAGLCKVKFYDFYNLKLEQVMRNLTCGVSKFCLW